MNKDWNKKYQVVDKIVSEKLILVIEDFIDYEIDTLESDIDKDEFRYLILKSLTKKLKKVGIKINK